MVDGYRAKLENWWVCSSFSSVALTTLAGTTGNDILNAPGSISTEVAGFQGNDTITLVRADDEARAGAGNDTIILGSTGAASQTVSGGSGDDTLSLAATVTTYNASVNLNDGNDLFLATAAADTFVGGAIGGNAGTDTIRFRAAAGITNLLAGGGTQADSIALDAAVGVTTNSTIFGGAGADTLRFNSGAINTSTINSGDGHDILVNTAGLFGGAATVVALGRGLDSINVGASATIATLAGGAQSDTITIGAGFRGGQIFGGGLGNTVDADATGADVISFTAGDMGSATSIYGAGGSDTITFAAAAGGNQTLVVDGGNGTDLVGSTATTFGGFSGVLTLAGGAGHDTILVAAANSAVVLGGAGLDTINMGAGANVGTSVDGGAGNDTINYSSFGAAGATFINGQTINGGAGTDSIILSSWTANAFTAAAGVAQFTALNSGMLGVVVAGTGDVVRVASNTATVVSAAANFIANQIYVASGTTAGLSTAGGASAANFSSVGDLAVFRSGTDLVIAIGAGNQNSANTFSLFTVDGGAAILQTGGGFGTRAIASAVTFTVAQVNNQIGFTFA